MQIQVKVQVKVQVQVNVKVKVKMKLKVIGRSLQGSWGMLSCHPSNLLVMPSDT